MHVFLSYPAASQKLADRLRAELSRDGLSISAFDARERAGVEWRKQVEPMLRAADDILILVGPRKRPDEAQQLEWQMALQAVWQDPGKRLIPVLVRDAAPPPFVFGDYAGDDTKVIRLLDPRDVRGAAVAIRKALQRGSSDVSKPEPPAPDSVDVGTKAGYYPALEEARQERIQELKEFAERLRDSRKS